MARCYGSRIELVAGSQGLGEEIVTGLHEAELLYLHDHEWARSADDVLWRRTKLGLHLSPAQREKVARWWGARYPETNTHTNTTATPSTAGDTRA